MIIKNTQQLLSHGNIAGRKIVLDILEAGLEAPDPYPNMRRLVRVEGGKLIVGGAEFIESAPQEPLVLDLAQVGHIYVVGGGKAVQRLAEGLEDALGDLITDGQINAKKGDTIRLKRIPVILAGHPLPDEDSERGGRRMLEIEARAARVILSSCWTRVAVPPQQPHRRRASASLICATYTRFSILTPAPTCLPPMPCATT